MITEKNTTIIVTYAWFAWDSSIYAGCKKVILNSTHIHFSHFELNFFNFPYILLDIIKIIN